MRVFYLVQFHWQVRPSCICDFYVVKIVYYNYFFTKDSEALSESNNLENFDKKVLRSIVLNCHIYKWKKCLKVWTCAVFFYYFEKLLRALLCLQLLEVERIKIIVVGIRTDHWYDHWHSYFLNGVHTFVTLS